MTELVNILAEFAHSASISHDIERDVTERILDTIGNSLAGKAESLKLGEKEPDAAEIGRAHV